MTPQTLIVVLAVLASTFVVAALLLVYTAVRALITAVRAHGDPHEIPDDDPDLLFDLTAVNPQPTTYTSSNVAATTTGDDITGYWPVVKP